MSNPPPSHRLHFLELDRDIDVRGEETIFHSARRNGVRIVGACGGRGTCGTCVVRVVDGRIDHIDSSPPELLETDADPAHEDKPAPGRKKWLRACQLRVRSDCTVQVAPRSLAPVARADVELGNARETLALDPAVSYHEVSFPAATLDDNRCDADRLLQAMHATDLDIDIVAARQLPSALRESGGDHWSVHVVRRGRELISFTPTAGRSLGLAVDFGTTNVAAFLLDLQTGSRVASLGIENPQTAWGADLISRINHAIGGPRAAADLRDAAVAAINGLAHDLSQAVGCQAHDIVDAVICGNTAMHHLFLGLPVRQLGRAPFVAALQAPMDVKARDVGLSLCPGAWVHLAPNVGGFVGGDHVTALLATEDRWRNDGTSLVMDIGTNTEISLIHQGEISSASCPSGPALEGGHISCGMRAAEGAIERVCTQDGRFAVQTIGGLDAVGLCGSGVLDALSAMRRLDIVSARGRIRAGHPEVEEADGLRSVLLAPGVRFSQHDVRAVQMAKAAIRAGVELLLRGRSIHEQEIDRFIIAGAFGAHIDIASGVDIGLFPDLPVSRFAQVGNAAGQGTRQMLASLHDRARAAELARTCRYVELSTRNDFQKTFMHHIGFPAELPRRQQ